MALIEREMPVNRMAEILGVNPQRVWSVFNHWIGQARDADDPSPITQLGVDETSSRKGHKYVTLGVDLTTSRVIHACEGKGTLNSIQQHLEDKGVTKGQIRRSAWICHLRSLQVLRNPFPLRRLPLTGFMLSNCSIGPWIRCAELNCIEHEELKGHKYTFLRNRQNLSDKQKKSLSEMIELYPNLGKAYRLKVLFNDLWEIPNKAATMFLTNWCNEVEKAKIPAFVAFAKNSQGALVRYHSLRRITHHQRNPGRD